MAIYRTISMSFWTDSKVVDDFTPEDRYFYLYLFTNPHTNLCGCYEISLKQVANETGYSIDSILTLLNRFENVHDVLRYSKRTKEVLLLNWHKYNWTSSEKFKKPLLKEISEVKDPSFKDYLQKIADIDADETDTVSIPYAYPTDTSVTGTVTDTVSDIDIQEKCKSKKKLLKNAKYTPEFETFWSAYPRKEGKGDAFLSFIVATKDLGVSLQTLLDGIERYKKTEQWNRSGTKYIPHPVTWLNQKRWEDSPEEQRKQPTKSKGNTLSESMTHGYDMDELRRRAKE